VLNRPPENTWPDDSGLGKRKNRFVRLFKHHFCKRNYRIMKFHLFVLAFFVFSTHACANAPDPKQPSSVPAAPKPDTSARAESEIAPPETTVAEEKQVVPVAAPAPTKTGSKKRATPIEKEAPAVVPVASAPDPTPVPAAKTPETPAVEVKIETPVKPVAVVAPGAPAHDAWDALLQKHVGADGKVDYKGFKSDKADLEAYLKTLADNPVQAEWSRAEKMAYWINAYNAFTVKLIVDNYPTKSILNFDGGKTWDVKRITLGGKKYSLNQIENDILRPQYKDARIHFAVNCAARSCPPLYNRAFTAENLESALEARAEAFINNAGYNKISTTKANVSKIFEWYAADFGDLKKYLNKYSKKQLSAASAIVYNEYDWDLNE
jgi:Protein of unknown function, DUF547